MISWWDFRTSVLVFAELLAKVEKKPAPTSNLFMLLPFVFIAMLFYFMFMVPDQKKRKEHEKLLQNLKQNDQVVTMGGILGTVVNVQKDYIVLRIDDNTNARMRVLRSAILRVETEESKGKDVEKDK
jgi:preprotein translocase subunit YajC